MSELNEENTSNRSHEFYGVPDGYIRRESIFKVIGALVGIFGAFLGAWRFLDSYREYCDRKVENMRIEMSNKYNRLEDRVSYLERRSR